MRERGGSIVTTQGCCDSRESPVPLVGNAGMQPRLACALPVRSCMRVPSAAVGQWAGFSSIGARGMWPEGKAEQPRQAFFLQGVALKWD